MFYKTPKMIGIRSRIMNCVKNNTRPLNISQIHRKIGVEYYSLTFQAVNYLTSQGRLRKTPNGTSMFVTIV